jgi:hypothetical protein
MAVTVYDYSRTTGMIVPPEGKIVTSARGTLFRTCSIAASTVGA